MKTLDIWTDGSSHNNGKYKGCGGYGAVMHYGEPPDTIKEMYSEYGSDRKTLEVWGAGYNTTNQQMEIKAVTEALKRVTKDIPIRVISDSAYVVNCFKDGWWRGWIARNWKKSDKQPVKNQEYWKELLAVIEDSFLTNIEWIHVKGHKGIFYNEVADDLAGKGTEKSKKESGLDVD